MDAFDFITRIRQAGFAIGLMDGNLAISPASNLNDEQREWIRGHKPELVSALQSPGTELDSGQGGHDIEPANGTMPESLVRAALDLCDSYRDNQDQRAQMLDDLHGYPPESWAWLEQYFIETSVRMDMERIPPMVRCCDCSNATIEAGIASCGVGVDSDLPIAGYWATDRHLCGSYEAKP